MRDTVVIQSLQGRGFDFSNTSEMLKYEAIEREARFLDKEPSRLQLRRAKETPVFGCKAEFVITYTELLNTLNDDVYILDLSRVKHYIDKEVYCVLQTLIRQGITSNKSIADACYEMFKTICMIQCDTITVSRVYTALSGLKETDYYGGQLLLAINECLFGEDAIGLYWDKICEFSGMYKEAMDKGREYVLKNCKTTKDVDKFVQSEYKAAKADKEFFTETYTKGVSKALVAALHLDRKGVD